jgi:hypothetical protein
MLSDYQTLTDVLVADTSGRITPEMRDMAVNLALFRYSADRPQIKLCEIVHDGGLFLPLPEEWTDGVSRVLAVEYPAGRIPPERIAAETVTTLSGEKIMLKAAVAAGERMILTYTAAHVLTDEEETIPAVDREAVANWAAALLLDSLSSSYAGDMASTIAADSVEHGAKGANYAARAAACRKFYRDHMGLDDKRNAAAGTTVVVRRNGTSGRFGIVQRRRGDGQSL